jgi:hypothetical protein
MAHWPDERWVAEAGASLGLAIEPAWQANVARYLGLLLEAGRLVAEMDLPPEVEPAPRFEP